MGPDPLLKAKAEDPDALRNPLAQVLPTFKKFLRVKTPAILTPTEEVDEAEAKVDGADQHHILPYIPCEISYLVQIRVYSLCPHPLVASPPVFSLYTGPTNFVFGVNRAPGS